LKSFSAAQPAGRTGSGRDTGVWVAMIVIAPQAIYLEREIPKWTLQRYRGAWRKKGRSPEECRVVYAGCNLASHITSLNSKNGQKAKNRNHETLIKPSTEKYDIGACTGTFFHLPFKLLSSFKERHVPSLYLSCYPFCYPDIRSPAEHPLACLVRLFLLFMCFQKHAERETGPISSLIVSTSGCSPFRPHPQGSGSKDFELEVSYSCVLQGVLIRII
jgi:hypothetical protein